MELERPKRHTVTELCRELVRIPSPSGGEGDIARFLKSRSERFDLDEVFIDDFGNVILEKNSSIGTGPRIHFDGHLDTVGITQKENWKHEPFGAEIFEGKLFGRGAADMKGPLAAMICAIAFLPRKSFRGSLCLSATTGEEVLEGAALLRVLEERPCDWMIIGEGTSLNLGVSQKGRVTVKIVTSGKAAHSSSPTLGTNAVYEMVEAIERIRRLDLPKSTEEGLAFMELNEIQSSPLPSSGMIPDHCKTIWDRRLLQNEDKDEVLEELKRILKYLPTARVFYEDGVFVTYNGKTLNIPNDYHPAWRIAKGSRLSKVALSVLKDHSLPSPKRAIHYCSNGSVSSGRLKIPTIILGPGDPSVFHQVDEYIELEELWKAVEVYMDLIVRLSNNEAM